MRATKMGSMFVVIGLLACSAKATTTLNGSYDGATGSGYVATGGSYLITPPATFNDDVDDGASFTSSQVTVQGGEFNDDGYGLYLAGSSASVSGGEFYFGFDGIYADASSTLSVTGGAINSNTSYGIEAGSGSTVSVYGGTYSGDFTTFRSDAGGSMVIYGAFVGMTGTTETLTGIGFITGTLQDETTQQRFSYDATVGPITLHTDVPEPASLGLLGVAGMVWLRRRRR